MVIMSFSLFIEILDGYTLAYILFDVRSNFYSIVKPRALIYCKPRFTADISFHPNFPSKLFSKILIFF